MRRAADVLDQLDLSPEADPLHLRCGPVGVAVHCPDPLRAELAAYFAPVLTDQPGTLTVHLLPDQALAQAPVWTDWAREPGKTGRKDAICDLDDARLIQKVRSGVTFVQSADHAVAFGPLAAHVSTVINFVNTQILNACLRDGWVLCHAAALTGRRGALAISGLSGGGKSTSMLRLMEQPDARFLSNDRLLVRAGTPPEALGIPKHPRINPGTILGNPRLHGMLSEARRAELAALPTETLRALEDKHDLIVPEVYGPDRMQLEAPLAEFWVLNWAPEAAEPTRLTPVDLATRPDLLGAIVKSPGPFYQHPDGEFEPNGAAPALPPYLAALKGVPVFEVTGRIDFDALATLGADRL